MIDLHSHVLSGIDDGPATLEGSIELARAAVAAGTDTLVATPHVSPRYANDAATIAAATAEVAAALAAHGVELELLAGAEIAITRIAETEPAELALLTLGRGPWLLVEPPFTPVATGVDAIIRDLLRRGHRVLLAHPERCPAFHRDPAMLEALVREGVLTSITAASLTGQFGGEARRFGLALIEAELAHNVASDAHDHVRRPPGMDDALATLGSEALGEWLTHDVPAALLAGEDVPPRPAAPARVRRLPWQRRR